MRLTTWTTSAPIRPTTIRSCVPHAHTLTSTQRGTSIDGAHLIFTKGVLSAQFIDYAFYRVDHIFADIVYYHP